jgi:hypothetical protein
MIAVINLNKFEKLKAGGLLFFSSHTQELKYEPLHPLVVNGGNMKSWLCSHFQVAP